MTKLKKSSEEGFLPLLFLFAKFTNKVNFLFIFFIAFAYHSKQTKGVIFHAALPTFNDDHQHIWTDVNHLPVISYYLLLPEGTIPQVSDSIPYFHDYPRSFPLLLLPDGTRHHCLVGLTKARKYPLIIFGRFA